MIQRIQTVYLAIVALLLILSVLLEVSLASVAVVDGNYQLTVTSIDLMKDGSATKVLDTFPIAGAISLGLFLTIYGIMQYKSRKFQMKLVQGALLVHLAIGGLVFYYADQMADLAEGGTVSYNPLLALLLVNVILCFLAFRGIKKDDELVRSADRLR